MALGFWAGVQQYDVEGKAAKKARQEFLAEQLTKTKSIVLPELIKRLDTRREKTKAKQKRVDYAMTIGFDNDIAIALERSGQLENQLGRIADLEKNEKLSPDYIRMLNAYVKTRVESDEDLQAAILEGIGGDSYLTESEQLEGLLASVAATDNDEFSLAIEMLQPSQKQTVSDIDPFGFAQGKGYKIDETQHRKITNRLSSSLKDIMATQLENIGSGGAEWLQFKDDDVNTLISNMADQIVDYERSLDYSIDRDELVGEAIEVMRAINPALANKNKGSFGTAGWGADFAKTYFADVFKTNITGDYLNVDTPKLWDIYIDQYQPEITTEEIIENNDEDNSNPNIPTPLTD